MVLSLLDLGLGLGTIVGIYRRPVQPGRGLGQPEIVLSRGHSQLGGLDVLFGDPPLIVQHAAPVVGCFGVSEGRLSFADCLFVLRVCLRDHPEAQTFKAVPSFLKCGVRLSTLGLQVSRFEYRQYLAGLYLLVLYYPHRLDLRSDLWAYRGLLPGKDSAERGNSGRNGAALSLSYLDSNCDVSCFFFGFACCLLSSEEKNSNAD